MSTSLELTTLMTSRLMSHQASQHTTPWVMTQILQNHQGMVWSMTRRVKTLSGVARRRGEGGTMVIQTTSEPPIPRPLQPVSPLDNRDDEDA